MTQEQYKQFREDFTSIVWYKGHISAKRAHISKLYAWDRNGSHQKAIDKATQDYNNTKSILKEKLSKYGMSYEQLLEHSKSISALNARIKRNQESIAKYVTAPLKLRQTKERLLKEFQSLGLTPQTSTDDKTGTAASA